MGSIRIVMALTLYVIPVAVIPVAVIPVAVILVVMILVVMIPAVVEIQQQAKHVANAFISVIL